MEPRHLLLLLLLLLHVELWLLLQLEVGRQGIRE